MNTRQIYYLTGGLILFAAGVLVVGLDYGRMRADLTARRSVDGALADDQGQGRRPKPFTEEELKSDMLRAEEYLRQNSKDSAKKAKELYTNILSYDTDATVNRVARFGLASALYRLGDDRRALEHLRALKSEDISDRTLSENVDFLLGRILLLSGNEDEGRSILQSLLARTTDKVLLSRIHAAFGDYYAQKGDRKRARKSYRIAVEYYPDNFHAAFSGESARRFADMTDADRARYDLNLTDKIYQKKESVRKKKAERTGPKKTTPARQERKKPSDKRRDDPEAYQKARELYARGLSLSRKNAFSDALKHYGEALELLKGLQPDRIKNSSLRNRVYRQLEHVYFRMGEATASMEDSEKARAYFDRVLSNPDSSLDQAAMVRKGILLFDAGQYEKAYMTFNRAIQEFPDGSYTRRAAQWMRETENFIKKETP